jgi:hypothetical protein
MSSGASRYDACTAANNNEPLFREKNDANLFGQTFNEATVHFAFELRGLQFNDAKGLFSMKPAVGLGLPEIMQRTGGAVRPGLRADGAVNAALETLSVLFVSWQHGGAPDPSFTKFQADGRC